MVNSVLLDEIQKIIDNESGVLFVGSGVSIPLGFPSWIGLTEKILRKAYTDTEVSDAMITLLKKKQLTPIKAVENVYRSNESKAITEVISTTFSLPMNPNLHLQSSLSKLFPRIITTNYDTALESAVEKDFFVCQNDDTYNISQISNKAKYIFKIHGTHTAPTKCIVTESSYQEIYENRNHAVSLTLQNIISNKSIIFIGYGGQDPYVNMLFDFVSKVYEGNSPKHYLITTDTTINLSSHNIRSIVLESYDELPLIFSALKAKEDKSNVVNLNKSSNSYIKEKFSVSVLSPKPFDKQNDLSVEPIINTFARFDVELNSDYLSIETLSNLNEVDYIIIWSNCSKGRLLIEDEFIKTKYIDINEIDSYIGISINTCFVFYSGDDIAYNDQLLNNNYVFIKFEQNENIRDLIHSFHYKVLTKGDITKFDSSWALVKKNPGKISALKKGIFKRISKPVKLAKAIDRKNFQKFIGRKTDTESIIRKLTELKIQSKILTIKGSGGIGKTTIIGKAALELCDRNFYIDGVHFVACNGITSFDNFTFEISQVFDLTSSTDLESQIMENFVSKDRLLILDNFETLLALEESGQIISLVSFLCDYACIAITSRQTLNLDYEDVYELRNLTTDEGVELFKTYFNEVTPNDEKILRNDVVERLLNNNPLAIKIIAQGLPKSKSISLLREELEKDIFSHEDLGSIFERQEDINIEKSKSLYHSINYSYQKLSDKEKLAFEVLSLFPDGIHMENFKKFCKSAKTNPLNIDDRVIRDLDNKSLLENSNGSIKLQSIINRFAEYQFSRRESDIKQDFYTLAFDYSRFMLKIVDDDRYFKTALASRIHDSNINNYLRCLDVIKSVNVSDDDKIEFVYDVARTLSMSNQQNEFNRKLDSFEYLFERDDKTEKLFRLISLKLKYYGESFDGVFDEVQLIVPLDDMELLNVENIVDELIMKATVLFYQWESQELKVINIVNKQTHLHFVDVQSTLYRVGCHKEAAEISKIENNRTFFDYEVDLALNNLTIEKIDNYLKSLYKKQIVEIVQVTYLKSKMTDVHLSEIKKLVKSNPYTRGLIKVMLAKIEEDYSTAKKLYQESLQLLLHIKYYYAEVLIEYIDFLLRNNDDIVQSYIPTAYEVCKIHNFHYLLYKLNNLISGTDSAYVQPDPFIDGVDMGDFYRKYYAFEKNRQSKKR